MALEMLHTFTCMALETADMVLVDHLNKRVGEQIVGCAPLSCVDLKAAVQEVLPLVMKVLWYGGYVSHPNLTMIEHT